MKQMKRRRNEKEIFADILICLHRQWEDIEELRQRFGIYVAGTDVGGFVGDTSTYDPIQKRILISSGLTEAAEALGLEDCPMVSKGSWVEVRGDHVVLKAPGDALTGHVDISEGVG